MNSHEGSSSDIQQASSSSSISVHESPMHEDHSAAAIHGGHKLTLGRKEEDGDHYESASDNNNDGSSVKWMSSKMRLMKKMMTNSSNCGGGGGGGEISAADHNMNSNKLPLKIRHKFHQYQMHDNSDETNNNNSFMSKSTINNNNNTTVRVCSDCNTTTTPLWRSGPRGPKSLCNACGIRQRKARRAMEAAAAAGNTGEAAVVATDNVTSTTTTAAAAASTGMKIKVHINKEKKGRVGQYKNKQSPQSQKKLICFKEFALSLSKNSSALQRVFPQDVEDAAILLMELSCGLIHT
ncbi:Zinc finger, GATA-type [Corchorus capsularis]|uniref:Zinc finger, GATA-type n=1 Tax=Corchorus capsularis TaxID=210143 RepID=A0A1R3H986_COCAP|nr:Zinc finger, GATA-type [Corchorus capsularis]